MPEERVPREGNRREDGILHPGAEVQVDEIEKGGCPEGNGLAGDGRAEVNCALREGVDGVGEGVADADDEGGGLRRVNGTAAAEEGGGCGGVGVGVEDVEGVGGLVGGGGGGPFEGVGEGDLVGEVEGGGGGVVEEGVGEESGGKGREGGECPGG